MIMLNRRSLIAGGAGMAAMGTVAGVPGALAPAYAQDKVDLDELLVPSPLGDKVLGDADAPVTVVEYASMSCPHCASFHNRTWYAFKEKYVDTGQVRFVFREYPIDAPAYAVAMVARCAPADKFFPIIDLYLSRQDSWLR